MVASLKWAALAIAAFHAMTGMAQDGIQVEEVDDTVDRNMADVSLEDMQKWMAAGGGVGSGEAKKPWTSGSGTKPPIAVDVNVSFPDAEIFGVKMVNGRPTRALLSITNNEPVDVTVLIATAGLLTPLNTPGAPEVPVVLRNLTGSKYGTVIPSKTRETITYSFATVMQPQDLTLDIKTVIARGPDMYTLTVFSELVSIVEAPVSIFDPQIIFLYLFLAAAFGGTCYFIYTTWITTLFPQKKRGGRGGERAKRTTTGQRPVSPTEQIPVTGSDGPAVATSSKAYDESWIPEGHLNKPQARRVGGGRPKSRAA